MRNEARRSFRSQIPEGQTRGTLRHAGRLISVELLDTSSCGFAFFCPESLPLRAGSIVQLRSSAGWHEVVVVRCECRDSGLLIGADRLGDLDEVRSAAASHRSVMDRMPLLDVRKPRGACAAAAIVSAFVGLFLYSHYTGHGANYRQLLGLTGSAASDAVDETADVSPPPITPVAVANSVPAVAVVSAPVAARVKPAPLAMQTTAAAAPVAVAHDESKLLRRQNKLIEPTTRDQLRLTSLQARELERLLQKLSVASVPDAERWELVRQREAQILQILTPAQAAKWRSE